MLVVTTACTMTTPPVMALSSLERGFSMWTSCTRVREMIQQTPSQLWDFHSGKFYASVFVNYPKWNERDSKAEFLHFHYSNNKIDKQETGFIYKTVSQHSGHREKLCGGGSSRDWLLSMSSLRVAAALTHIKEWRSLDKGTAVPLSRIYRLMT